VARPVSLEVDCFGTERAGLTTARIEELVREHFDLRPAAIIQELDLRRPIYAKTAAYGHFGRDDHDFTWERVDKAAALREAAGLGVPAATPAESLRRSDEEPAGGSLADRPLVAGQLHRHLPCCGLRRADLELRARDEPLVVDPLHELPPG